MLKSNISDVFFFINIQKSKLIQIMIHLWKKTLKMQNIVILVKSVFNENCNHYYYEKLLENINRNNL